MDFSKLDNVKKKLPKRLDVESQASPDEKTRFLYEIDKSSGLTWTAYEHEVVNNEIVKTTVLVKDIKAIAKRKLELKLFWE